MTLREAQGREARVELAAMIRIKETTMGNSPGDGMEEKAAAVSVQDDYALRVQAVTDDAARDIAAVTQMYLKREMEASRWMQLMAIHFAGVGPDEFLAERAQAGTPAEMSNWTKRAHSICEHWRHTALTLEAALAAAMAKVHAEGKAEGVAEGRADAAGMEAVMAREWNQVQELVKDIPGDFVVEKVEALLACRKPGTEGQATTDAALRDRVGELERENAYLEAGWDAARDRLREGDHNEQGKGGT